MRFRPASLERRGTEERKGGEKRMLLSKLDGRGHGRPERCDRHSRQGKHAMNERPCVEKQSQSWYHGLVLRPREGGAGQALAGRRLNIDRRPSVVVRRHGSGSGRAVFSRIPPYSAHLRWLRGRSPPVVAVWALGGRRIPVVLGASRRQVSQVTLANWSGPHEAPGLGPDVEVP